MAKRSPKPGIAKLTQQQMKEETKGRKSKIVFEQGYQVVCQEPGEKGAIRGMVMKNTIAEDNSSASYVIL